MPFPGGITSADEQWQAVIDDQDLVSEAPVVRGSSQNGWHGGFLDDAAEFDAGFFGISPRESRAMDPQPRVLLEVTWEAMEHAPIDTSLLREPVGVYVGIIGQEYGAGHGTTSLVADLVTGTTVSVASGHIAYTFGLLGPALSIDTACSSSLIAMHVALQALRTSDALRVRVS